MGVLRRIFDLYWQDNFLNNKIQSDKDNFLDNLIYEIAIMGVLGSIFRQDNFLTIYERFWHLGGHVNMKLEHINYFRYFLDLYFLLICFISTICSEFFVEIFSVFTITKSLGADIL